MRETGKRGAATALRLMEEPVAVHQHGPDRHHRASRSSSAPIGEPLIAHFFDPLPARARVSFVLSFAILTYLGLVVGELVPKALALQHAERIATARRADRGRHAAARPSGSSSLSRARQSGFCGSSASVRRLSGSSSAARRRSARCSPRPKETGVIEEAEEEMIYKVFDFAEKEVARRHGSPARGRRASRSTCRRRSASRRSSTRPFTRYPAYRGSLDEIVGILHVRDLFSALYANGIENVGRSRTSCARRTSCPRRRIWARS